MDARKLKWLRIRNWAALVALIPVAAVACLMLSPVLGVFAAIQIVNENLKGGLK